MFLSDPRKVGRRRFLATGALAGLGLHLGDFFALRSAQAASNAFTPPPVRAKSVIHIYLTGGMAAQESWDPKPDAPIEYRGELGSVGTKLPGVRFSELLRKTAGIADKLTVVRSLTHGEAAHERGQHNMMTGYRPSPALLYPSLGSVVSHEYGPRKNLPPYISIPGEVTEFGGSGYLSSAYAPFSVGGDPANAKFAVRDLNLSADVSDERYHRRLAALETINKRFTERAESDAVSAMDTFYQRAYDLIGSEHAREAFNLQKEPGKVRDRYGRNAAGQRLLLARRLVESGARFVTLTYGGWDHHQQITQNMRRLVPALDQGFSTLINDLDERGLLDDTLVMVSSEFGRTPKINADAGRDHWSKVFSVALAGGGIKRGAVVGSSDATANEPAETPISPEDLAATVFHQLGIAPEKELMAPGDRPIEIVKGGRVREELLA
ncbi:Sulfatase [Planctomycetes bacterium MalM25]|nr:Sulfatase [Planctomycetes bacterium MalM25]